LLDIWLFSRCTACIGTGTGPDSFPNIYRRPTLFVNFLPLINLHHYHFTLTVPKNLSWIESGKELTFEEYCDAKFMSSHQYLDAGIEIVDLSEDEIAEVVREFWGRVTGDWVSDIDAEERQSRLWRTYMAYSEYSEEQLWKHPEARIGEQWLKARGNDFLPWHDCA
jgi:putative glycosyltransferase (TIGR04372 family)